MPRKPYKSRLGWPSGLLAITALPLALLLDTAMAMRRGWAPASAGALGNLRYLAILVVFLAVLLAFFTAGRRFLGNYAARLWLLTAAIVIGLGLAEIGLAVDRPRPPFHLRPPGSKYVYDPDPFSTPGVIGTATTSINDDGVRGPAMPEGSYRILCLGGGAAECVYLDDTETWPALLAADLDTFRGKPVWAGSAGFSEYSTAHHLKFLEESPLVDEVDAIVLLCGVNDLVRTLLNFGTQSAEPPHWLTLAPVELIRETWNVTFQRGLTMDTTGESLRTMRLALPISAPSSIIPWPEVLAAYRERLTSIVTAANSRGVRLLFVSQPALWKGDLSPYHARRYWLARIDPPRPGDELSAALLREQLDRFNREMQNVAAGTQTPFLDAARSMNGRPEYFYDDYHLSEKGNEFLARLVADHWPSAWAASRGTLPPDQ